MWGGGLRPAVSQGARHMGSAGSITTTPWTENFSATEDMMMVPPWMVVPLPNTELRFEQCRTHKGWGCSKRKPVFNIPLPS
jgi:L,D-peptidoglycan transpeptidase YkuD (ErfK/YbiS/YcfS/YnhG family)